jgi:flagellar protein FliO/FliZ
LPARIPCTALIVWILLFPVTNVSAQNDPAGDKPAVEATDPDKAAETPDPIRARQEMMVFGGEETGTEAETARPVSTVSVFSILRMLLTLAVVAAAIYGLVYFLKFRRASRAKADLDPFLKILASVPLGPSRGVHVVSVGPQAWLVGSAETGVNLISEIGDKDTINAMLLEDSKRIAMPPTGGTPLLDFKAILERLGISTQKESSGPDQIRKRSERLKGL